MNISNFEFCEIINSTFEILKIYTSRSQRNRDYKIRVWYQLGEDERHKFVFLNS